jgi:hypothetical protein
MRLRITRFLTCPALLSCLALLSCQQPVATTKPAVGTPQHLLLDFEKPDLSVTWIAAAAPSTDPSPSTEPATQPAIQAAAPPLLRNSVKPHAGLWSLATNFPEAAQAAGQIRYTPPQPLDLGSFDLLTAQVSHEGPPSRNGQWQAWLRVTDESGQTAEGDHFPILSTWQGVTLDLAKAFDGDLDPSRIASISLFLQPDPSRPPPDEPLNIKTDSWATQKETRVHQGSSVGAPRSFFVESRATAIHVGSVGQYEMVISDQGIVPAGQPWLKVYSAPAPAAGQSPAGPRLVLGQPSTGLYLLDQDGLSMSPVRNATSDDVPPGANEILPLGNLATRSFNSATHWSWPASINHAGSTLHWQVTWTSPVAAIIEGRQEAGGFDQLGEPLLTATWRLMIYQWGQVFVDVRWTRTGDPESPGSITRPVSWMLQSLNRPDSDTPPSDAEQRLLAEIYPATFRDGLATALPHRMQSHLGVAMIAPANLQKNNFWWARDANPTRWIFGTGLATPLATAVNAPNSGEATCMLLVNSPNGLQTAGCFGQYLVPPKIIVRQGELDRNFPGDSDNDGFVESYGFQVVRLAAGRAAFTLYPQERPIFYPPVLFTVPAAERNTLDLKHSTLLINIDGKQFANPPQFPDGSFLLQVPYVLDRPVSVEAILVK